MNPFSRPVLAIAVAFALLAAPAGGAHAQRLYDKDKDEQAQDVSKKAGEVTSGSAFEKQLKNLKMIVNQDFATYFMDAKRQMNLDINAFISWSDVREAVCAVKQQVDQEDPYPQEDINAIRAKLKLAKQEAETQLKELRKAAKKSDELTSVGVERLEDLQALAGFAEELLQRSVDKTGQKKNEAGELLTGVKALTRGLTEARDLYKLYKEKMKEIEDKSKDLIALRVPMQKVAVARLQVEDQHLKTVAAIKARRASDQADVMLLFREYEEGLARLIREGVVKTKVDLTQIEPLPELACVPADAQGRVADEEIEDTVGRTVAAAEETSAALKEAQENASKAASARREAESDVVERAKALEEAEVRLAEARGARAQAAGRREVARAKDEHARAERRQQKAQAAEVEARDAVAGHRAQSKVHRKQLASVLDVLHVAAALSAYGATPSNLAALRLAQEEHRYSIRKSAVLAQAYEVTLSTGAQRLALYYKGGLRPEKIAQLVYSAASVAVPPAILAR